MIQPSLAVRAASDSLRLRPSRRFVRFAAEDLPRRSKHSGRHSGPFAAGPSFKSGDSVRETGIYEVTHKIEHRAEHEVVLLNGDVFPRCETCQAEVAFRLIRTAPYIFQDADFEEN
ncbi:MAG: hypothetical protein JOZ43_03305 [Acidobacteriales bacterium]|nr:hypothetical protein [Terriglobales bacterium]